MKLLGILLMAFTACSSFAQITSNQSGNWSSGSTWVGGVAPGASDDVIIQNGHDITVTANASCDNLLINSNSNLTTFTVNSSVTLTLGSFDTRGSGASQTITINNNGNINVSGKLYFWDKQFASHTINLTGSGKTSVTGVSELNANKGNTINIGHYFLSSGVLYLFSGFSGDLAVNVTDTLEAATTIKLQSAYGSSTSDKIQLNIDNSSAVLYLNGTVTWSFLNFGGELRNSSSGGLVLMSRRQNYNNDSRLQFGTLALDATTTLNGAIELVNGENFKVMSGTSINHSIRNIEITGNLDVDGTLTGTTGAIVMNGSSAQTMDFASATSIPNLNIENTGGGVTISGSMLSITDQISFDATGTTAFNTGGLLTLVDGGSGMANFGDINNHTVSGNITCQFRSGTMNAINYRHLSMPVSGVAISDIQYDASTQTGGFRTYGFTGSNTPSAGGFFSTYTYNNSSVTGDFDDGWVGATNSSNSLGHQTATAWYVGPGSGQGASSYSFDVSGSVNTGAIKVNSANGANFSYDAGNAGDNNYNWALIGNPYPSTVDWDLVHANTNTVDIESVAYIYSSNGGGYVATNSGGNTDLIPPFQGFYVRTSGASSTVEFNENDKSTTQKSYVKSIQDDEGFRIYISSDQTTKYSFSYLKFNSKASDTYINGEDAYRIKNPWPWPNIAVVSSDDVLQQVHSQNLDDGHEIIKINVETYQAGNHTLRFESNDDLEGCFILEDLVEKKTVTIDPKTGTYTFFLTDSASVANRFKLHIYNFAKNVTASHISCFGKNDGEAELELSDIGTDFRYELKDEKGNGLALDFSAKGKQSFENLVHGNYSISVEANKLNCPQVTEYFTILEPSEMIPSFDFAGNSLVFYSDKEIKIENKSTGGIASYAWDFGDKEFDTRKDPTHVYAEPGIYTIKLTAQNGNSDCDVSAEKTINVINSYLSIEDLNNDDIKIIQHDNNLKISSDLSFESFQIIDLSGKAILQGNIENTRGFEIDINILESGIYLLRLNSNTELHTLKFYHK